MGEVQFNDSRLEGYFDMLDGRTWRFDFCKDKLALLRLYTHLAFSAGQHRPDIEPTLNVWWVTSCGINDAFANRWTISKQLVPNVSL